MNNTKKLLKKRDTDEMKVELYRGEGGKNPCMGDCGCSANYDDYDDGYCHCGGCGCGCYGCQSDKLIVP